MKDRIELAENIAQALLDNEMSESSTRRDTRNYNNFVRLPKIELPTFTRFLRGLVCFLRCF